MRSVTPRPRRPTFARLAFEKKCFHQHIPTLRNRNAIWRWSIIPAAIIQKQPSFTAHRSRVGKKRPISRQRITKSWLQITPTCSVRWAKPAKRSSWKRGRANDGADKFRARSYLVISACAREMAAQFNRPSFSSSRGGIGRRVRLRTVWGNPWRFETSREHCRGGSSSPLLDVNQAAEPQLFAIARGAADPPQRKAIGAPFCRRRIHSAGFLLC